MINLKIDPEFQSQIPPLTDDEFKQLEENILKEGKLLSPLIVWGNTLVDGHNRYAILQKHPEIYFSTMPLRFENREEAIAWICRNQLGRRNLSPEQKRYLLGKQYEAEKKAAKIFRGNQYTLAKKSGGDHGDNHHSGKKTCDRIAEENGVSRASVLRASHYTRGIDIADNLSPGIKQKVFSGEVKFTNEEMSKLVQASVEHRSDVLAQILHPEALEVLESASAEFEPEKAEPVPMPTPQTEEFRCYHVPDEFMKVYKSLSRATEMMKNSWKKTLKNNPSYFTDPEKQKVLRFAMQRPANYLTVFFEAPFWIGVFERIERRKLSVCKVVFGAEPKDYEVWEYLLKNYSRLRFSPSVETVVKKESVNPKRLQRQIRKETVATGIGTKSQQALQMQREENKLVRKALSRKQREAEKQRQFELKQQKRKEKHRGR